MRNLPQVSEVMSRDDIREWLRRYYEIPPGRRMMSMNDIARHISYEKSYVKAIRDNKFPMSPAFQVRFSAYVKEFGWPRVVEKTPQVRGAKKEIPPEVYERFAEGIALLNNDAARGYGINKEVYLAAKNGCIVKFRYATLKRLYEKVTGEAFIW